MKRGKKKIKSIRKRVFAPQKRKGESLIVKIPGREERKLHKSMERKERAGYFGEELTLAFTHWKQAPKRKS